MITIKYGGNMSTPIYQIYIIKNNVAMWQAYNALSEVQKKDLNEKQMASLKTVGAQQIVGCFSAWADEAHPYWGMHRFPGLEARIKHTQTLQQIGWLEGMDAFTLLGTSESEPVAVTIPNPIYKLWVIKASPAGAAKMSSIPQGKMDEIWEKHDALMKELGVMMIILCNSKWCNEAYPVFGIDAYPNIEANIKMMQALDELGWNQFFDSFTLLGIPVPEGM
jgi:hypothetical protein